MASGFKMPDGRDFDDVFEPWSAAQQQGYTRTTETGFFGPDGVDLGSRYAFVDYGERITGDTGLIHYFPATEDETYCEPDYNNTQVCYTIPGHPAGQFDLADVFAAKGSTAIWQTHPYFYHDTASFSNSRTSMTTASAGTSSYKTLVNITGYARIRESGESITQYIIVSVTGDIDSAAIQTQNGLIYLSVNQSCSVSSNPGSDTATGTVVLRALASNGIYTDDPQNPYPNKTIAITCEFTYNLAPSGSGGGPIQ